jgi:hypothetical protein
MVQLDKKRKKIFDFIKKTMDKYDIDRTDDDDIEWIFEDDTKPDINKLYEFNKEQLLSSDDKFIKYLLRTIKLIKNKKINNMDKESMVIFTTSGFCWSASGKFTIFNER